MKALTVRQPWAWAIIHAGKNIENRTQNWTYRGPLAIHAGLTKPEQNNQATQAHRTAHGTETPTELVFGAIIGLVDLIDVHPAIQNGASITPWPDWCCQPWGDGRHITGVGRRTRCLDVVHLVLTNPRPIAPIPCRGALGLWTPRPETIDQINDRLPGGRP